MREHVFSGSRTHPHDLQCPHGVGLPEHACKIFDVNNLIHEINNIKNAYFGFALIYAPLIIYYYGVFTLRAASTCPSQSTGVVRVDAPIHVESTGPPA